MSQTAPPLDFIAAQLRKPSGNFATNIAKNMDKANEPLYDLMLEAMKLRGDERLLEIGFGSGSFMSKLFAEKPNLKVTGIDYSLEMVNLAGTNNSDLIKSGSLTLQEGSSEHLPFPDESFDAVFCNMVIFFWDNPEAHLREVRRALKPAGKFYAGFRTKESMQRQMPFVKYGFTLYEADEWQALLERNGFKVLGTDTSLDPAMEVNGQKFQLESVCVAAQKQSR